LPEVDIVAEDIPGWSVASKGSLTVALDITLTDELNRKGCPRIREPYTKYQKRKRF
jgi:isoleucyl-tRNA synthetase